MDSATTINLLRQGRSVHWPEDSHTLEFAQRLDQDPYLPNFRDDFLVPTQTQMNRQSLKDAYDLENINPDSEDSVIYFCGNSLGLQPKAVSEYLGAYLKTWGSIAVGGHFTQMRDSPLVPFQDMAADCAKKSVHIVGALPQEIVIMNSLTVNLHLMMCGTYADGVALPKIYNHGAVNLSTIYYLLFNYCV